jgi:hypothetical protein
MSRKPVPGQIRTQNAEKRSPRFSERNVPQAQFLRSLFSSLTSALSGIFVLGLVVIIAGCGRQRRDEPVVNGMFIKQIDPTDSLKKGRFERWIEITDDDAMPDIPRVLLNGNPLPLASWNPIDAVYDDNYAFETDTSCAIEIEHHWGKATSRVYIPADFEMTGPGPDYVYNRDSLLTIRWQPSRGATWYWLNLFLDYDYRDTLNEWDYYEFDRDTILFDTLCVYERNRFFPGWVRKILDGEVEAVVWAMDGPVMAPGAMGNVWGDGFGYVNTANQPHEEYFVIVQPPVARHTPGYLIRRSREKLIRRLQESRRPKIQQSLTNTGAFHE